jgi:condensin complex subunit 2
MGGDEFEGAVDMNNLPDDAAGPIAAPVGEGRAGDEQDDLLAATQGQIRRARPQFVNYAKKAKRVDVKKLKENIWRELAIDKLPVKKPRRQADEASDDENEEENEVPQTTSEAKQFTSVISGLRKIYPEDKMEEISTSFCFICLLHLANEEGLRISEDGTATASEASGSKRRVEDEMETIIKHVGGLDKLRINRELTT